mmetsp:Transcript_40783/g.128490  ORF Transcript_40783/g.128490 Transcript_40783/m.128490 type:complete len:287 (-) Transcript_40783:45-905(-)
MSVLNCANQRAQIFYASSACLINSEEKLRRFSVRYDESKMEGIHMNYIKSKAAALKEILGREDLRYRLTVLYPCVVLGPRKNGAARLFEEAILSRTLEFTGLAPSTHFIHARDAATVITHLIDRPQLGRCDPSLQYTKVIGDPFPYQPIDKKSRSKRNSLCTRHLILAQPAFTSLWVRSLGGSLGAAFGLFLGWAGAPRTDLALAGWSIIVWTMAGLFGGASTSPAIPSGVVTGMMTMSETLNGFKEVARASCIPASTFPTAVNPEALGLQSCAPTFSSLRTTSAV